MALTQDQRADTRRRRARSRRGWFRGWSGWTGLFFLAGLAAGVSAPSEERGEFGGDLGLLRRFHRRPQMPGESNHCLDLWADQTLASLVRAAGLTNNRALFINSHGEAVGGTAARRYAFIPHESLGPVGGPPPRYSVQDVARVLGPEVAAAIHNVVVAGCNAEGAFSAAEVRRHFVHATNVISCPAGQRGYQAMFFQALLAPSSQVEPLYETVRASHRGGRKHFLGSQPRPGARRLAPYLAELFLPGADRPFRTQVAGRELLQPNPPQLGSEPGSFHDRPTASSDREPGGIPLAGHVLPPLAGGRAEATGVPVNGGIATETAGSPRPGAARQTAERPG